jgi:ribosomal protein L11
MSKSTNSFGQPILNQIFKLIPLNIIENAVNKRQSDKYYKSIPVKKHLVCMLFGVLSHCNGLRELCEGLLACEGKLNHLGMDKAIPRSTLSDANRGRSYLVFQDIYFALFKQYLDCISDSRLKGLSIRNLKIIDSTTIQLFTEILKGVGRNTKDGSKKKGGFKVHAMMDAFSGVVEFCKITAAKVNDRQFLYSLKLPPQSFIVMDKAYNVYSQFDKWTKNSIWFVTRMKSNAIYRATKTLQDHTKKKNRKGVMKEQLVIVKYKSLGVEIKVYLRRIEFKDEAGRNYVFITNEMKQPASKIALIYKYRWMIELLFKQMKQNFPLKYFWGDNVNAIKSQVYSVLIAQLLMVVIRKKSETKKSFANMIAVVRLHIMSYVDLFAFIKDTYSAWRKNANTPNLFSG